MCTGQHSTVRIFDQDVDCALLGKPTLKVTVSKANLAVHFEHCPLPTSGKAEDPTLPTVVLLTGVTDWSLPTQSCHFTLRSPTYVKELLSLFWLLKFLIFSGYCFYLETCLAFLKAELLIKLSPGFLSSRYCGSSDMMFCLV